MALGRWCACVMGLAVTAPLEAQRLPQPYATIRRSAAQTPRDTTRGAEHGVGRVALWSLVGGAAGLAAGYAIGYPLLYVPDRNADLQRGCEDCGTDGALETLALMALAETVGVALGAHLGNSRHGNLGTDVLVSAGSLVLAAFVVGQVGESPGAYAEVVGISLAQIGAVVLTERGTGHTRARAGQSLQPSRFQ